MSQKVKICKNGTGDLTPLSQKTECRHRKEHLWLVKIIFYQDLQMKLMVI